MKVAWKKGVVSKQRRQRAVDRSPDSRALPKCSFFGHQWGYMLSQRSHIQSWVEKFLPISSCPVIKDFLVVIFGISGSEAGSLSRARDWQRGGRSQWYLTRQPKDTTVSYVGTVFPTSLFSLVSLPRLLWYWGCWTFDISYLPPFQFLVSRRTHQIGRIVEAPKHGMRLPYYAPDLRCCHPWF